MSSEKFAAPRRMAGLATKRTWVPWFYSFVAVVFGFGDDILTVLASTIKPEKVNWLWPNRIPLGKLTLFVGDPDNGKSMVGTYLTAITTTGRQWCDSKNTVSPSEVFIFASEDDPADTTVPRLMAAGADREKIYFPQVVTNGANSAQEKREMCLDKDVRAIKKALDKYPSVRLIIIDPVSNYLGGIKMNDEKAVRHALTQLKDLAAETGVAIVGIMHLNKKEDLKEIHRIGGAMGFVGVARAVWRFTADDKEPGVFHMLPVKKNIGPRSSGLKYRISTTNVKIQGEPVPQPMVKWLGESNELAETIVRPKPQGRPRDDSEVSKPYAGQQVHFGPTNS